MSSSINDYNSRLKVVLFCGGLANDGDFFKKSIDIMKEKSSSVVVFDNNINMKYYDAEKDDFIGISSGSLMPTSEAVIEFNRVVAEIVDLCERNPNFSVMVKTKLDEWIFGIENGEIKFREFDSIEHQSGKLVKIIKAIKNINSEIEIILVGHSQGGLVNLKVATIIPSYIKKIVSISTPYSPVKVAKIITVAQLFFNLIKKGYIAKDILDVEEKIYDDIDYHNYTLRINELANFRFFNSLKKAWNSLTYRPSLTAIIGISSHLLEVKPVNATVVKFLIPFDGLVCAGEQADITNANLYILHDENREHYLPTNDSFNSIARIILKPFKNYHINLPIIDYKNDFVKGLFTKKLSSLSETISEAINDKPISNTDYKNYYDMVSNRYSHKNIINQDETIGILLSIFER